MTHSQKRQGYVKRYLVFNLRQRGLVLILGAIFLAGVILGSRLASGDNGVLEATLQKLIGGGDKPQEFTSLLQSMVSSFTTNGILLFLLFLCGFCAISQPMILFVLVFKGLGFGLLGGFLYGTGEKSSILYYTLVLLPEMLLTIALLLAAARESLNFTKLFLAALLEPMLRLHQQKSETSPMVVPLPVYCARFVLYLILNGMVAFLIALFKLSYFTFLA